MACGIHFASRRRNKTGERERERASQRGLIDDDDAIQRCRFLDLANGRNRGSLLPLLLERTLTSSRRGRGRRDNSSTHGERQASNERGLQKRERTLRREKSDKAAKSLFFFAKQNQKTIFLPRRNHGGSSRIQSCVSCAFSYPCCQTDQSIAESSSETARRAIEFDKKNSFAKKRFFVSSSLLFRLRSSCDGSSDRPGAARQGH